MQGSLRIGLIPHLSFVVLIIIRCGCLRLLLDWLGGVIVCACCWIGWVVLLFALVVGLVGRCRCLRLLLCLLVGVVVCACCWIGWAVSLFAFVVGFIGRCWCECRRHDTPAKPRVVRVPKARTEPWVNTDKSGLSSVGAALSVRAFAMDRLVFLLVNASL